MTWSLNHRPHRAKRRKSGEKLNHNVSPTNKLTVIGLLRLLGAAGAAAGLAARFAFLLLLEGLLDAILVNIEVRQPYENEALMLFKYGAWVKSC